jgi:hypothetical protein
LLSEFGAIGPPDWSDRPVFLLGGGPSLSGFDFDRLRPLGYRLGINQAIFDADCDAGISIDHPFVRNTRSRLAVFAARRELFLAVGDKWRDVLDPIRGAIYLRDGTTPPLSLERGAIYAGGTSGYAALNAGVLKGARRIVLLGFDYGLLEGRRHYHDAYTWAPADPRMWRAWAIRFNPAAKATATLGVAVVNASPASTVTCFPKMSIDDALAWATART